MTTGRVNNHYLLYNNDVACSMHAGSMPLTKKSRNMVAVEVPIRSLKLGFGKWGT